MRSEIYQQAYKETIDKLKEDYKQVSGKGGRETTDALKEALRTMLRDEEYEGADLESLPILRERVAEMLTLKALGILQ